MKLLTTFYVACLVLSACTIIPLQTQAQRACGNGILYQQMAKNDPEALKVLRQNHDRIIQQTNFTANPNTTAKATAQNAIPIVFHFILDSAAYATLGNDSGILRRVYSQLRVLNEDYNAGNADKILIPDSFKRFYTNVNIQFGLAKAQSTYTIQGGVEIKMIPKGVVPNYTVNNSYLAAKTTSNIGLDPWDVTKYLNIWIVNAGNTILGITVPNSQVGTSYLGHIYSSNELGVVLNMGAIGSRDFPTQYFMDSVYDKGRTLTHELGHFFELSHIWGDDNGACPGDMSGGVQIGFDDGIADTPPQADATYCTFKPYVCPSFPKLDKCSPQTPGIMFMNYMDYTDDRAMQMFTTMQGAVMHSQIELGGESYSLTQNPQLLGVSNPGVLESDVQISPNPAINHLQVRVVNNQQLIRIEIVNLMGQMIGQQPSNGSTNYDFELSFAPRGIYLVKCQFAEGTLTRKIVLQ